MRKIKLQRPRKFRITIGEEELFSMDILELEATFVRKKMGGIFGNCFKIDGDIINNKISFSIYAKN